MENSFIKVHFEERVRDITLSKKVVVSDVEITKEILDFICKILNCDNKENK